MPVSIGAHTAERSAQDRICGAISRPGIVEAVAGLLMVSLPQRRTPPADIKVFTADHRTITLASDEIVHCHQPPGMASLLSRHLPQPLSGPRRCLLHQCQIAPPVCQDLFCEASQDLQHFCRRTSHTARVCLRPWKLLFLPDQRVGRCGISSGERRRCAAPCMRYRKTGASVPGPSPGPDTVPAPVPPAAISGRTAGSRVPQAYVLAVPSMVPPSVSSLCSRGFFVPVAPATGNSLRKGIRNIPKNRFPCVAFLLLFC